MRLSVRQLEVSSNSNSDSHGNELQPNWPCCGLGCCKINIDNINKRNFKGCCCCYDTIRIRTIRVGGDQAGAQNETNRGSHVHAQYQTRIRTSNATIRIENDPQTRTRTGPTSARIAHSTKQTQRSIAKSSDQHQAIAPNTINYIRLHDQRPDTPTRLLGRDWRIGSSGREVELWTPEVGRWAQNNELADAISRLDEFKVLGESAPSHKSSSRSPLPTSVRLRKTHLRRAILHNSRSPATNLASNCSDNDHDEHDHVSARNRVEYAIQDCDSKCVCSLVVCKLQHQNSPSSSSCSSCSSLSSTFELCWHRESAPRSRQLVYCVTLVLEGQHYTIDEAIRYAINVHSLAEEPNSTQLQVPQLKARILSSTILTWWRILRQSVAASTTGGSASTRNGLKWTPFEAEFDANDEPCGCFDVKLRSAVRSAFETRTESENLLNELMMMMIICELNGAYWFAPAKLKSENHHRQANLEQNARKTTQTGSGSSRCNPNEPNSAVESKQINANSTSNCRYFEADSALLWRFESVLIQLHLDAFWEKKLCNKTHRQCSFVANRQMIDVSCDFSVSPAKNKHKHKHIYKSHSYSDSNSDSHSKFRLRIAPNAISKVNSGSNVFMNANVILNANANTNLNGETKRFTSRIRVKIKRKTLACEQHKIRVKFERNLKVKVANLHCFCLKTTQRVEVSPGCSSFTWKTCKHNHAFANHRCSHQYSLNYNYRYEYFCDHLCQSHDESHELSNCYGQQTNPLHYAEALARCCSSLGSDPRAQSVYLNACTTTSRLDVADCVCLCKLGRFSPTTHMFSLDTEPNGESFPAWWRIVATNNKLWCLVASSKPTKLVCSTLRHKIETSELAIAPEPDFYLRFELTIAKSNPFGFELKAVTIETSHIINSVRIALSPQRDKLLVAKKPIVLAKPKSTTKTEELHNSGEFAPDCTQPINQVSTRPYRPDLASRRPEVPAGRVESAPLASSARPSSATSQPTTASHPSASFERQTTSSRSNSSHLESESIPKARNLTKIALNDAVCPSEFDSSQSSNSSANSNCDSHLNVKRRQNTESNLELKLNLKLKTDRIDLNSTPNSRHQEPDRRVKQKRKPPSSVLLLVMLVVSLVRFEGSQTAQVSCMKLESSAHDTYTHMSDLQFGQTATPSRSHEPADGARLHQQALRLELDPQASAGSAVSHSPQAAPTRTFVGDHKRWPFVSLVGFMFLGASGNILVCMAVLRERRLQTATNYFLLSLAVADLLVCVLVMPFGIVYELYGKWPFDWRICNLYVTCDVLTCSSSILHMCFISVGRYLGIRNPLHARQANLFVSRRAVLWRIAIAWLLAILIASPITMMALHDPKNIIPQEDECAIANKYFLIIGSLIAFFIPMFVMVPSYVMTVRLLSGRAEFVRNNSLIRNSKLHNNINSSTTSNSNSDCNSAVATNPNVVMSAKSIEQVDMNKQGFEANSLREAGPKSSVGRSEFAICDDPNRRLDSAVKLKLKLKSAGERKQIRLHPTRNSIHTSTTNRLVEPTNNHQLNINTHKVSMTSRLNQNSALGFPPATVLAAKWRFRSLRLQPSSSSAANANLDCNQLQRPQVCEMMRYLGSSSQVKSEQKATKVLGVVFFTFVICWTPFFVINFTQAFVDRRELSRWISKEMMTTFLWLGYISSTINPIIYTIFNKNFRRAFRQLLLCQQPNNWLSADC